MTESPTVSTPVDPPPTTATPTTATPTTASPTTASPTTASPTTASPTAVPPTTGQGWWTRTWRTNWQKVVAAVIWLGLTGAALAYGLLTGSSPNEVIADLVDLLRTPWGPLLYILVYAVRPLAFFSAVVVTLVGGAIWGPVLGTLYVIIGSNLSATLAYAFGRILGRGVLADGEGASTGIVQRYADRLRRNAFTTVLIMRLVYLPYDLVTYIAGFLRVPYRPFILASILGSLPGTLTFVLAGASLDIDDILAGQFSVSAINPITLVASVVLFVAGLAVSRLLRRREGV